MLDRVESIRLLNKDEEHECAGVVRADGYYQDTNTVECASPAVYLVRYTTFNVHGSVRHQTTRYWCDDCLPNKFTDAVDQLKTAGNVDPVTQCRLAVASKVKKLDEENRELVLTEEELRKVLERLGIE